VPPYLWSCILYLLLKGRCFVRHLRPCFREISLFIRIAQFSDHQSKFKLCCCHPNEETENLLPRSYQRKRKRKGMAQWLVLGGASVASSLLGLVYSASDDGHAMSRGYGYNNDFSPSRFMGRKLLTAQEYCNKVGNLGPDEQLEYAERLYLPPLLFRSALHITIYPLRSNPAAPAHTFPLPVLQTYSDYTDFFTLRHTAWMILTSLVSPLAYFFGWLQCWR